MKTLSDFYPKRILICQLRQLGDVILTTPAAHILRRLYPESEIHFLTEKRNGDILEGNPDITKIWRLDKKSLHPLHREIFWYRHVASQNFDLVIDFQQLPRIRWVVAFSGAQVRLSYTAPWYLKPLYTHTVPMQDGYAAMSKASILRVLGAEWHGERPRIYLAEEERKRMRDLLDALGLKQGQRLITLDTTHRRITRKWPTEHFARMVHLLLDQDPSLRFLPLWGPGEQKDAAELAALCPEKALILTPDMLNLREMAACIAEASLHIGNCSAPRHIAVAVDTPTCITLGATSQAWTFPSPEHQALASGLPCQPCNRNNCSVGCRCLKELSPQIVAAAALRLLNQFGRCPSGV